MSPLRPGSPRAPAITAAVITVLASALWLVLGVALADRAKVRSDVTLWRQHALAPRAASVLDHLAGEYELVLALDPREYRRGDLEPVSDLLLALDDAAPSLRTTIIDLSSAGGAHQYASLLARLAERDRAALDAASITLSGAVSTTRDAARLLSGLSPRFNELASRTQGDPSAPRDVALYFQQRGTIAATASADVSAAADRAESALAGTISAMSLPPLDSALDELARVLGTLRTDLGTLGQELDQLSRAQAVPQGVRDDCKPLARSLRASRDACAIASSSLSALARTGLPDALRIARALEQGPAALVIGPPDRGVTAISLDALLVPPSFADGSGRLRTDPRRHAEELLTTALGSIAVGSPPIVVFVHAQDQRFGDRLPGVGALFERLSLQGMTPVEWAASLDPEPPPVHEIDPAGVRPVVFVGMGVDAVATSVAGVTGPERAKLYAAALQRVTEAGEPVLVSLGPSLAPGFGQSDPVVQPLLGFGLGAETARPLLARAGAGAAVQSDLTALAAPGDSPISRAIAGLPAMLPWPIAVVETDPPDDAEVRRWPLLKLGVNGAWGETDWLAFWRTPRDQRALLQHPPTPDPDTDLILDSYTVAYAAERSAPRYERPQRVVVVGSLGWFFDAVALQRAEVEGRATLAHPGNIELFESSLLWLAHRDGLIAESAGAAAVALIRPLSDAQRVTIRWILLAALPMGALALGVLWKVWRG